jgi:hypothetical protein
MAYLSIIIITTIVIINVIVIVSTIDRNHVFPLAPLAPLQALAKVGHLQ